MWRRRSLRAVMLVAVICLAACRPLDMYDQAKYEAYEYSEFYPDGRSARLAPEGTFPLSAKEGQMASTWEAPADHTVTSLPFDLDLAGLKRGQQRYTIYCAPCHGPAGYGDGMIVQRGYTKPPSFHTERLRQLPLGHYYHVISEGLGAMPPYRAQIPQRDRWLIAAYLRALQLSQRTPTEALPPAERQQLKGP